MKKIFLLFLLNCFFITSVYAETKEFSSIEEAEANASAIAARRNRELLKEQPREENLPKTENDMLEYIRQRLDNLDITVLPEGDRLDKASSFSRVDDSEPAEKKSTWEKIYDEAMERLTGKKETVEEPYSPVQYYSPVEDSENQQSSEQIPTVNVQVPGGMVIEAPAYEHIPYYSTQIEVVPNRVLKVVEQIVVVANGEKVKNPLIRFIDKNKVIGKGKFQIVLESVLVNDTPIPYEVAEDVKYYILKPAHKATLPEGVYVFEFKYFVENYLEDKNDFYQLYWDLNGGHFNLLVTRAVIAVRLPGVEPAVKRYALTGRVGSLTDKNSVVKDDKNNISGFMNLYPLMPGDSMYLFLTLPKVDFLAETTSQKVVSFINDFGDILFCAFYLIIVILSCGLSWHYIHRQMKFRNVSIPTAVATRALWRGASDIKSVGCALLDMYRKSLIEIEENDNEVILVRKTAHARRLADFERRILALLFSKKDSICRALSDKTALQLKKLVKEEGERQIRWLGAKLASMYMISNVVLLLLLEIALAAWNPNVLAMKVFAVVDVLLLLIIGLALLMRGSLPKKILLGGLLLLLTGFASLILLIYFNWVAVIMMFIGIWIAVLFSQKASGFDAMLKNAVRSTYQMKEFLSSQKEMIGSGRNFAVQQPNIFALDLEDDYSDHPKIHDMYKLRMIKTWLNKVY